MTKKIAEEPRYILLKTKSDAANNGRVELPDGRKIKLKRWMSGFAKPCLFTTGRVYSYGRETDCLQTFELTRAEGPS